MSNSFVSNLELKLVKALRNEDNLDPWANAEQIARLASALRDVKMAQSPINCQCPSCHYHRKERPRDEWLRK